MEYLPPMEVFNSLEEMSDGNRDGFLKYLSASIGYENGLISEEILDKWNTKRVFVQRSTSGIVIGSGLLLAPSASDDYVLISGLCYESNLPRCGQRVMEAVVTTWKYDFAHLNLCADFPKDNAYIQCVARDLGFVQDTVGSDDMWVRFELSSNERVKPEDIVNSLDASVKVEDKATSSMQSYQCEVCQKTF
eukprot:231794_1